MMMMAVIIAKVSGIAISFDNRGVENTDKEEIERHISDLTILKSYQ